MERALHLYEQFEFSRQICPSNKNQDVDVVDDDDDVVLVMVKEELQQMLASEAALQRHHDELLALLAADEDETRQQLKHFAPLELVEREAVHVTTSAAATAEQLPELLAKLLESRKGEIEAQQRVDALSASLSELLALVAAQERDALHQTQAIDLLARQLRNERAPLEQELKEAEELARQASELRSLEAKLRGEIERLEAERATLIRKQKTADFLFPAATTSADKWKDEASAAKHQKKRASAPTGTADYDVFFW